jgi:uncharacterized SAM-dependent methyltransferase
MAGTIYFYDYHPPADDIRAEVLEGLQKKPKQIPPKYFYDQRGSRLFDVITGLPGYLPGSPAGFRGSTGQGLSRP